MRVAKNDVVRVRATGEVGTVADWLLRREAGGNRVTVVLSRDSVRHFRPSDLEFVADAKPNMTTARAVWALVLFAAALALGVDAGYRLAQIDGVSVLVATALGFFVASGLSTFFQALFIKPRKTSVG